ncbi:hypothetical protein QQY24_27335 [Streptomyces sp. TG1A-8]|uniref:hypothetical protein n=1 Tax=Streptomyces sp. TG1A-8 TaxID=3051385 RepID=UPI00265C29D5|nr:hypothetical protein [Streptomyces sp. TG1A-8]MDO0928945.1 hypothetical protein [Streptomyces sp. TG1A-8]
MLTIPGPDGSVLGQFAADAQDAEILAKRVHEMSADRYGRGFATDLVKLMRRQPDTTPLPRPGVRGPVLLLGRRGTGPVWGVSA